MSKFLIVVSLIIFNLTFGQTEQSTYNNDKESILKYFRTETIGGKLDFDLKTKEDKALFYRVKNTLYSKKDFGILLWAQALKRTGEFSLKEAFNLWEEIRKRKLTKPEKKAFKKGFKIKTGE